MQVPMNQPYAVGVASASNFLGISRSTFINRTIKHGGPPVLQTGAANGIGLYQLDDLQAWDAKIREATANWQPSPSDHFPRLGKLSKIEDGVYCWETSGKHLTLREAELRSPKKFQRICTEQLMIMPSMPTRAQWLGFVERTLNAETTA